MQDRTRGNVPGVHFYDEPGLTWLEGHAARHPQPGPLLRRCLRQGADRLQEGRSEEPRGRQGVAALGEVEAGLHGRGLEGGAVRREHGAARLPVADAEPVRLDRFTDGYYFNVGAQPSRSTAATAAIDDYGPGYFNPSYFLEMARARDFAKPEWYLPQWYGNTPPTRSASNSTSRS